MCCTAPICLPHVVLAQRRYGLARLVPALRVQVLHRAFAAPVDGCERVSEPLPPEGVRLRQTQPPRVGGEADTLGCGVVEGDRHRCRTRRAVLGCLSHGGGEIVWALGVAREADAEFVHRCDGVLLEDGESLSRLLIRVEQPHEDRRARCPRRRD